MHSVPYWVFSDTITARRLTALRITNMAKETRNSGALAILLQGASRQLPDVRAATQK